MGSDGWGWLESRLKELFCLWPYHPEHTLSYLKELSFQNPWNHPNGSCVGQGTESIAEAGRPQRTFTGTWAFVSH
jgi:hypothetical protein